MLNTSAGSLCVLSFVLAIALSSSPCVSGRRLEWATNKNSPPPPAAGSIACSNGNCSGLFFPYAGSYANQFAGGSNVISGSSATSAFIYQPLFLATYLDKLYIADGAKSTGIFVVNSSQYIFPYAGLSGQVIPTAITSASLPFGATATSIQFAASGLCVDQSDGTMYVPDRNSKVVWRINAATRLITIFAGNGLTNYNNETGVAALSIGIIPTACTVSPAGDLYVGIAPLGSAQDAYYGILKIAKATAVVTRIYYCERSGATCIIPTDFKMDSYGNLFIADNWSHYIFYFNITSGAASIVAGNGLDFYSLDGFGLTNKSVTGVSSMAIDSDQNLIYPETAYNRVRLTD